MIFYSYMIYYHTEQHLFITIVSGLPSDYTISEGNALSHKESLEYLAMLHIFRGRQQAESCLLHFLPRSTCSLHVISQRDHKGRETSLPHEIVSLNEKQKTWLKLVLLTGWLLKRTVKTQGDYLNNLCNIHHSPIKVNQ